MPTGLWAGLTPAVGFQNFLPITVADLAPFCGGTCRQKARGCKSRRRLGNSLTLCPEQRTGRQGNYKRKKCKENYHD